MPDLIMEVHTPAFWLAIGNVIWIDALLSGDNAVVIAMACHNLSPKQRFWGIALGALSAVLMRVAFTGVVSTLITLPYLRIVGGACLMIVAVKMCLPDSEDGTGGTSANRLLSAIRIIVVADLIMSLDNMIAVAAVAQGNWAILAIGLVISIPLVVSGAAVISMVLSKLPFLIWAGAALLGWLGGKLMAADPALSALSPEPITWGGVCVVIVVSTAYAWPYLWGRHEHTV